jgi:hypothetical protein
MEKKLRIKLATAFRVEMEKNFPEFASIKMKSMYIFPGEFIWKRDTDACSYFIILSPDPRGQRDEANIELGWSRHKRFPELPQRPSLVTAKSISNAGDKDEGTVRIGSLSGGQYDWTPVRDETIFDVVAFFVCELQRNGMAFFNRI